MPRMSCFLTVDAVLDGTKTVTRRDPDTWQNLRPGVELVLIEKGQGLKLGEKQRVLRTVTVADNRVETLRQVTADEVRREGLWDRAVAGGAAFDDYYDPEDQPVVWFRAFWAATHYRGNITHWAIGAGAPSLLGLPCRRIEWTI